MSKFSCDLAEELWEASQFADAEIGDSETFGWFALFREDGAILTTNSIGFVSILDTDDVEATWRKLESEYSWFLLAELNESCDGLFPILDTARHTGSVPDFDDIHTHIESCELCDSLGNFLEV